MLRTTPTIGTTNWTIGPLTEEAAMGVSAKRGMSRHYFDVDPKAYDYVGMVIAIVYDGYTSWVTQVLIVL
jgi:hypothetical protein